MPENIEFLTKKFPKHTIDPFTGKSLIYQQKLDGYALYSVGENMMDGGGAIWGFDHRIKQQDEGIWLRKGK